MNRRAIGVFDSGLGGLTTVKQLVAAAPHEDIIFFGDTARVPYGTRTSETIVQFAKQDISFLLARDVKLVVAACGTVSSTLPQHIIERLPVPFVGVVSPTAASAAAATRNGRIGVIGTPATIQSGSFVRELHAQNPALKVFSNACPLFVPLVENGYTGSDCDITRTAAEEYLAPLRQAGVDTLILGCTHYPLLADIIADVMGTDVMLVDSGVETARAALALLSQNDALNDSGGALSLFTSDNPAGFAPLAQLFLGFPMPQGVRHIPLDTIVPHPCFENF